MPDTIMEMGKDPSNLRAFHLWLTGTDSFFLMMKEYQHCKTEREEQIENNNNSKNQKNKTINSSGWKDSFPTTPSPPNTKDNYGHMSIHPDCTAFIQGLKAL